MQNKPLPAPPIYHQQRHRHITPMHIYELFKPLPAPPNHQQQHITVVVEALYRALQEIGRAEEALEAARQKAKAAADEIEACKGRRERASTMFGLAGAALDRMRKARRRRLPANKAAEADWVQVL